MSTTRKRGKSAPKLAPSRAPKTPWQTRRDRALEDAGYLKSDVHKLLVERMGKDAPSIAGVRAALSNRYHDPNVCKAFVELVGGRTADWFPDDEPVYKGPDARPAQ